MFDPFMSTIPSSIILGNQVLVHAMAAPRSSSAVSSPAKKLVVEKALLIGKGLALDLIYKPSALHELFCTTAKVYRAFGWDYRKPVRAPPACPYKPTPSEGVQV
ncbi:hypothetical protein AXF42_Ash016957 [Apostasia shenzhenica]|uniref:Uncharacterized protein n=1 Tax=Apostasia shenzhenica TaxID=1088818 RepID=A0A2H9ZRL0_9ASPA|nr:hypothetical protein AXF42_Ash016957 [Apostasia shenzhenica]